MALTSAEEDQTASPRRDHQHPYDFTVRQMEAERRKMRPP